MTNPTTKSVEELIEAEKWLNEVGETVAESMFIGKQPPGIEVENLIRRIQANCFRAAAKEAQVTLIWLGDERLKGLVELLKTKATELEKQSQ